MLNLIFHHSSMMIPRDLAPSLPPPHPPWPGGRWGSGWTTTSPVSFPSASRANNCGGAPQRSGISCHGGW